MPDTWILYQTTNLVNGKIYVGVHKISDKKYSQYYLGSGNNIKAALKKYGRESFTRTTLAEFSCAKEAFLAEAEIVNEEFIKRHDTYNLKVGGEGGIDQTIWIGRKHKAESIEKMRNSQKGIFPTLETRQKLSIALKGRPKTDETKSRMSQAAIGNKRGLGTKRSVESKQKMCNSQPTRLTIVIDDVVYPSASAASKAVGVGVHAVINRAKSNKPEWLNWRFATEEEKLL
jgi:group I intron endonuclease